jgi:hypothetical protein
MNIAEGYEQLFATVGGSFESRGFLPNKKKDAYVRKREGATDTFSVRLSKKQNGRLWHHLTLEYVSAEIDRLFGVVEGKTRSSLGLAKIAAKRPTCAVTDWKSLLTKGQGNFWFVAFDELFHGDRAVAGYDSMIDAGVKWFDKMNDTDALLNHCLKAGDIHSIEIYLTALKIRRAEQLSPQYARLSKDHADLDWDDDELPVFYKNLAAAPMKPS